MNDFDEQLPPSVRDDLRRLYGSDAPPSELEDDTLARLRREGLVSTAPPVRRGRRRALAAAAALAIFFAGYAAARVGGMPSRATANDEGSYLLLLREPAGNPLPAPEGEAAVVAEYAAWAGEQARMGRLILGEKLADTGDLVAREGAATAGSEGTRVTGLFLVRAPDLDTARAIARTCPHVRRGGTIEVRPIVPT